MQRETKILHAFSNSMKNKIIDIQDWMEKLLMIESLFYA